MNSQRKNFLVSFLKYSISLAIAIFLFWRVYGDFDFKELFGRFKEVNIYLLGLSMFFGLLSYYVRAFRWNLLLESLGYDLIASRTFLATMIGYFANLLVPRMGEFTRCASLKRTDNVDFSSSFGSVVAERALDLVILILVTFVGLIIEFDKLVKVLKVPFDNSVKKFDYLFSIVLIIAGTGLVALVLLLYLYKKNKSALHKNKLYVKVRSFVRDVLDGLLTIKSLKRPFAFWMSTLGIWVLYYLMSYIIFLGFAPTQGLGFNAGLLVLIMGGFGMAAPVQGGVGTFHIFVSGILLLYGIKEDDGRFFAFVLHESQLVTVLTSGGLSFLISLAIPKRNAKKDDLAKNS